MATAVCQTPDCGNLGVPIEIPDTTVDADGNPVPVTVVVCGPCGQPIYVEGLTSSEGASLSDLDSRAVA
jgi:hypothetical protein